MKKMLILSLAFSGLVACSDQDSAADDESDTLEQSVGLDGSVTVTPGKDGGADAGRDAGRVDAGN